MEVIEGVVKVVSKKENNRYAIKLDNNKWYSGFGKYPEAQKRVRIEYTVTESGGTTWHNIKNWAYIEDEPKQNNQKIGGNLENIKPLKTADKIKPEDIDEMQRLQEIRRSVALKAAIEFVKLRPEEATLDLVIRISKHFEDYIKGEM